MLFRAIPKLLNCIKLPETPKLRDYQTVPESNIVTNLNDLLNTFVIVERSDRDGHESFELLSTIVMRESNNNIHAVTFVFYLYKRVKMRVLSGFGGFFLGHPVFNILDIIIYLPIVFTLKDTNNCID